MDAHALHVPDSRVLMLPLTFEYVFDFEKNSCKAGVADLNNSEKTERLKNCFVNYTQKSGAVFVQRCELTGL